MARVLTDTPNKLALLDNISNTEIELHYSTPTSKQVAAYANGTTKRVRNKIVTRVGENRQKYGKEVLIGIREGDFEVIRDGKQVPLSSDLGSDYHDPKWKKKVAEMAPDIIEALAIHVFEATSERNDPEDSHENDDDEDDDNKADLGDDTNPN